MGFMNTKFKKVLEGFGVGQVAVLTEEGDKLIGIVVDANVLGAVNPQIAMFSGEEGIWLKREQKLTFLGDHNIKSIKKAKPFEKEIDKAIK